MCQRLSTPSVPLLPTYPSHPSSEFYESEKWSITRYAIGFCSGGELINISRERSYKENFRLIEIFLLPLRRFRFFASLAPSHSPIQQVEGELVQNVGDQAPDCLPLELRLQVWQHSLPAPRVINLIQPSEVPHQRRSGPPNPLQIAHHNTHQPHPFCLMDHTLACREQHSAFYTAYTFLDLTSQCRVNPRTGPRVLHDTRRDIILIDLDMDRWFALPNTKDENRTEPVLDPIPPFLRILDLSRIQNLALEFSSNPTFIWERRDRITSVCDIAILLPALRTLTTMISNRYGSPHQNNRITEQRGSSHRLLEITSDFLEMSAVVLRDISNRPEAFGRIDNQTGLFLYPHEHFRVQDLVSEAESWKKDFALFLDSLDRESGYQVLREKKVQLTIATSAHLKSYTRDREVIWLMPTGKPTCSGASFYTRGWRQNGSEIVEAAPRRERFMLGLDEFACFAEADGHGNLKIRCQGLEDIWRLFQ